MKNSEKTKKTDYMYVLLLMLIMIVVNNSGGYVFLLLFAFLNILTRDFLSKMLLLILTLPISIELGYFDNHFLSATFINDDYVMINKDLNLEMIYRPFVFLMLYMKMIYDFLSVRD